MGDVLMSDKRTAYTGPDYRGQLLRLLACLLLLVGQMCHAATVAELARQYFPGADRVGEFEGDPLAAGVYGDGKLLGYVLRTTDIAPIPAYSGEPITLLVGLGLDGRISGLEITRHSEPILVVGVSEQDLRHYVEQYDGVSAWQHVKIGGAPRDGYVTIDGITGASITAMVMNATVMKSVQKVAESRGLPLPPGRARSGGSARPANPSGSQCGENAGGRLPCSAAHLVC
jgi:NosR/NirI family nitrous oxide reductase transcriptional regulator